MYVLSESGDFPIFESFIFVFLLLYKEEKQKNTLSS